MQQVFAGVDVGTGSVRVGLFDDTGHLLGTGRHPIRMWREAGEVVEQSSSDIWRAVAAAMKVALADAGVAGADVAGIGFDATCSLVAIGADGAPLTVSPSGDPQRNVIVWMDHRAAEETRAINASGDRVLRYVGGAMSPEMEMPKLLWLKRRIPQTFRDARHFFDLADFLGWRATGSLARSLCTVTCKWGFVPHEEGWSDSFMTRIGLGELAGIGHARVGEEIVAPGTALRSGLTPEAAKELGLRPGTPVAAGLIDAHAGGLGTAGGRTTAGTPGRPQERVAYIFGTSACIMASTAEPAFVDGVWGPYHSAMIPGLWLNEGGQSAAGAAIDHIVRSHPARAQAEAEAAGVGENVLDYLERRIARRAGSLSEAAFLARHKHVLPDFIGNRSPHADPDVRAAIVGLGLDATVDDLESLYVAALCGIAYGLADVLDALGARAVACETIVASGGASRSALVRQILADVTGRQVVLPETAEPVLLGSAILATVAASRYAHVGAAMTAMSRDGQTITPTPGPVATFHAAKRGVHYDLEALERRARAAMRS